jgi:hypothetical protein
MYFVPVAGTDLVLLVLLAELRNHHRTSRRRRGRSKTQLLHHCIRENLLSAKLLDEEASLVATYAAVLAICPNSPGPCCVAAGFA